MRVRLLDAAEAEAKEAARWYEEQRAGLGQAFLAELRRILEIVESAPRAFQQVEVTRTREVRRALLWRFPFKVIFEIQPDEVIVLAIAHNRRRPNYWKNRRT